MLPHGSGIRHYAFMSYLKSYRFCPFLWVFGLFGFFCHEVSINETQVHHTTMSPGLMYFSNKSDI